MCNDFFCLTQQRTPVQRHVIRPAAKWSGASRTPLQHASHKRSSSGIPTGHPDAAPSTSTAQPALKTHTPVQCSSSGHTQAQPGPSSCTLSHTKSRQQDGTLAHTDADSSIQTSSTSTNAKANAVSPRSPTVAQPQPSTSGLAQPRAAPSAHSSAGPQASASASTTPFSRVVATIQEKTSTSTFTQGASTSSVQPGPSTQLLPSQSTILRPPVLQVKEVKVVVHPLQPSIQASTLVTHLRSHNLQQPLSFNRMQGNLIQIEPQPLAQAPTQPPVQPPPQLVPGIPSAVLIAAAPERLGPQEAGHRIILGSQAPGEAVPIPLPLASAHNLNVRVLNSNPPAPPVPVALVPNNVGVILTPAPNLGRVVVPPGPEDVPQIEDARPGPSAPRERFEQQPHIRSLVTGVVSIIPFSIKLNHLICGTIKHFSDIFGPFPLFPTVGFVP